MPPVKRKPSKPKAKHEEPKASNKVLKEASNRKSTRTRTPLQEDNKSDDEEGVDNLVNFLGISKSRIASLRAQQNEFEDTEDMMGFPLGFSLKDKLKEIVTKEQRVVEKHIEYKKSGKENLMRAELYKSLYTYIKRRDNFNVLRRFMPKMSQVRIDNFLNEQNLLNNSKNFKVKVQNASKYIVKKHMKGTRTDVWDMITSIELINTVESRYTFWETFILKKKTNKNKRAQRKSIVDGIDPAKTPLRKIGKDIKKEFHQELCNSLADNNVDCYVKMFQKDGLVYFAARTQREHAIKSGGVKYDVEDVYFGWNLTAEHFFVHVYESEIENCQNIIDAFARTLGHDYAKIHKLSGENIHSLQNTYLERCQDFTEFKELKELYTNAKKNGEEISVDLEQRIKNLFQSNSNTVNEVTIVAKMKKPNGELGNCSKTILSTTQDQGIFPILCEKYYRGELVLDPFIILEMKVRGVNRISISEEELNV